MEALGALLKQAVAENQIDFHPKCKRINLVHLSFADDVLVVMEANMKSLSALKDCLSKLESQTGLKVNNAKTSILIAGMNQNDKEMLASSLNVTLTVPPVKYLGLPLTASNLSIRDCYPLVEKVQKRIQNWKNLWLTQAGRVLLINTVLCAFLVYWGQAFLLPCSILDQVQNISLHFLWAGPKMEAKMHHANKKKVVRSKQQGGLGIKDTRAWNKAAQCGLLFRVIKRDPSVWVQWVWENPLRNKFFWTMKKPSDCPGVLSSILEC
ncbi:hypothetical protein ACHQM5_009867 [Ranunculus cassubicifolius]